MVRKIMKMSANDKDITHRCQTCGRKETRATHLFEHKLHGRLVYLCRTCWSLAESSEERRKEREERKR
jgi:hypothetical protein